VEVRRYDPTEIPVLYLANDAASFLKSIEDSKDETNDLMSGVLEGIAEPTLRDAYSSIVFNLSNSQIETLVGVTGDEVLEQCVRLLYIQALFLAGQPLNRTEMRMLNSGIGSVISWGLKLSEGKWATLKRTKTS